MSALLIQLLGTTKFFWGQLKIWHSLVPGLPLENVRCQSLTTGYKFQFDCFKRNICEQRLLNSKTHSLTSLLYSIMIINLFSTELKNTQSMEDFTWVCTVT